jgi:hypothetical protein
MSESVQPIKPASNRPTLSRRSCSLSGFGDLARYSCPSASGDGVDRQRLHRLAAPGRSPSGWNDTDDTTSLRTSCGCLMAM